MHHHHTHHRNYYNSTKVSLLIKLNEASALASAQWTWIAQESWVKSLFSSEFITHPWTNLPSCLVCIIQLKLAANSRTSKTRRLCIQFSSPNAFYNSFSSLLLYSSFSCYAIPYLIHLAIGKRRREGSGHRDRQKYRNEKFRKFYFRNGRLECNWGTEFNLESFNENVSTRDLKRSCHSLWRLLSSWIWRSVVRYNDCFSDIIHRHIFYLKQSFGKWTLSPFSGKKLTQSGSIDIASPYLQSPKPTQDMIYKPNTT